MKTSIPTFFRRVAINTVVLTGKATKFFNEVTTKITILKNTNPPQIKDINAVIHWAIGDKTAPNQMLAAISGLNLEANSIAKVHRLLSAFNPLFECLDVLAGKDTAQTKETINKLREAISTSMAENNQWAQLGNLNDADKHSRATMEGLSYFAKTLIEAEPHSPFLEQIAQWYPLGLKGLGYYLSGNAKTPAVFESTDKTLASISQWIGHENGPVVMRILGLEDGLRPIGKALGAAISEEVVQGNATNLEALPLYPDQLQKIAHHLGDNLYYSFYAEMKATLQKSFEDAIKSGKSDLQIYGYLIGLSELAGGIRRLAPGSQLSHQLHLGVTECFGIGSTQIESQADRRYQSAPSPLSTLLLNKWIERSIDTVRHTPSAEKDKKIAEFIKKIRPNDFKFVHHYFESLDPSTLTYDHIEFQRQVYNRAPYIALGIAISERKAALTLKRNAAPWLAKMPQNSVKQSLEGIGENKELEMPRWSTNSIKAVQGMRALATKLIQIPDTKESIADQLSKFTTRKEAATELQTHMKTILDDPHFSSGLPKPILREFMLIAGLIYIGEPILCRPNSITQGYMNLPMKYVPGQTYFSGHDPGRKLMKALPEEMVEENRPPQLSKSTYDVVVSIIQNCRPEGRLPGRSQSTVELELTYLLYSITCQPIEIPSNSPPHKTAKSSPAEAFQGTLRLGINKISDILENKADPIDALGAWVDDMRFTINRLDEKPDKKSKIPDPKFDISHAKKELSRLINAAEMIIDVIQTHFYSRLESIPITGHQKAITALTEIIQMTEFPVQLKPLVDGAIAQIESTKGTPFSLSLNDILDTLALEIQKVSPESPYIVTIQGAKETPDRPQKPLPTLRFWKRLDQSANISKGHRPISVMDTNSALIARNLGHFEPNLMPPETESDTLARVLSHVDLDHHNQSAPYHELQQKLEKTIHTLIQKFIPKEQQAQKIRQIFSKFETEFDKLTRELNRLSGIEDTSIRYLDYYLTKKYPDLAETYPDLIRTQTPKGMILKLLGHNLLKEVITIVPGAGTDQPIDWSRCGDLNSIESLRSAIKTEELQKFQRDALAEQGVIDIHLEATNRKAESVLTQLKLVHRHGHRVSINENIFELRLNTAHYENISVSFAEAIGLLAKDGETNEQIIKRIRETLIDAILSERYDLHTDSDASQLTQLIFGPRPKKSMAAIEDDGRLVDDNSEIGIPLIPWNLDVMQEALQRISNRDGRTAIPPYRAIRTLEFSLETLVRSHKKETTSGAEDELQTLTVMFLNSQRFTDDISKAHPAQLTPKFFESVLRCRKLLESLLDRYPPGKEDANEALQKLSTRLLINTDNPFDNPIYKKVEALAVRYNEKKKAAREYEKIAPIIPYLEKICVLLAANGQATIGKTKLVEQDLVPILNRLNRKNLGQIQTDVKALTEWFGGLQPKAFNRAIEFLLSSLPNITETQLRLKASAESILAENTPWFNAIAGVGAALKILARHGSSPKLAVASDLPEDSKRDDEEAQAVGVFAHSPDTRRLKDVTPEIPAYSWETYNELQTRLSNETKRLLESMIKRAIEFNVRGFSDCVMTTISNLLDVFIRHPEKVEKGILLDKWDQIKNLIGENYDLCTKAFRALAANDITRFKTELKTFLPDGPDRIVDLSDHQKIFLKWLIKGTAQPLKQTVIDAINEVLTSSGLPKLDAKTLGKTSNESKDSKGTQRSDLREQPLSSHLERDPSSASISAGFGLGSNSTVGYGESPPPSTPLLGNDTNVDYLFGYHS